MDRNAAHGVSPGPNGVRRGDPHVGRKLRAVRHGVGLQGREGVDLPDLRDGRLNARLQGDVVDKIPRLRVKAHGLHAVVCPTHGGPDRLGVEHKRNLASSVEGCAVACRKQHHRLEGAARHRAAALPVPQIPNVPRAMDRPRQERGTVQPPPRVGVPLKGVRTRGLKRDVTAELARAFGKVDAPRGEGRIADVPYVPRVDGFLVDPPDAKPPHDDGLRRIVLVGRGPKPVGRDHGERDEIVCLFPFCAPGLHEDGARTARVRQVFSVLLLRPQVVAQLCKRGRRQANEGGRAAVMSGRADGVADRRKGVAGRVGRAPTRKPVPADVLLKVVLRDRVYVLHRDQVADLLDAHALPFVVREHLDRWREVDVCAAHFLPPDAP